MFHKKMSHKKHTTATTTKGGTTTGGMFWSSKPTLNAKRFSLMQAEVSGVDPYSTMMMLGGGGAAAAAATASTAAPSAASAAHVGGVLNDLLNEMDKVLVSYNDHHHKECVMMSRSATLDTTTTKATATSTKSTENNMSLQDVMMMGTVAQLHQQQQPRVVPSSAPQEEDIIGGSMFLFEPTPINTDTIVAPTTSGNCNSISNQHRLLDSAGGSSSSCLDQSFSQLVKSFDPSSMDYFIKQLQHQQGEDGGTGTINTTTTTATMDLDHQDGLLCDIFDNSTTTDRNDDVDDTIGIINNMPQPSSSSIPLLKDHVTSSQPSCYIQHAMTDDCNGVGGSTSSSSYSFFKPEQWEERYQQLVEFRNRYGHCLVPHNWEPNRALAQWVKRQRHQYKLKMKNLQQEEQAQEEEGSNCVDSNKWCGGGGTSMKRSTLTALRQQKLESIGFIWSTHNVLWEEKYVELQQFLKENGHCNVPSKYPTNPKLSVWVRCQRRQYKLLMTKGKGRGGGCGSGTTKKKTKTNGSKKVVENEEHQQEQLSSMTMERISKLKVLGFNFNPRNLKV